jgi:hypothetical protein
MYAFRSQTSWAVLAGLAMLAAATPEALAQRQIPGAIGAQSFRAGNALSIPPIGLNTTVAGQAFSSLPSFSPGAYANLYNSPSAASTGSPYSNYGSGTAPGYGGYGGYYESPLGGYLRGAAEVLNSEGRLGISVQQANLLKQEVIRAKIENRKRNFDEWLYEREKMPTAEDDRQQANLIQVRRSLNDPPVGEIYSGQALNTLLNDIQKKNTKDGDFRAGLAIALDEDTLRHLNVTGQENKGNPGLLKNEGRLSWPLALRDPQFQADRDALNELTPAVYDQAVTGRVDASSLEKMTRIVRHLGEQLNENIRDLTPSQYAEARRFLGNFEDALALLRQPGAGEYFGAKAPKGKTIGELIQHMVSKGLRFAPATAGDEPAYVAVHRALASYAVAAGGAASAER